MLKLRLTQIFKSSLLDVIQPSIDHLQATSGAEIDIGSGTTSGGASSRILAPDGESYLTFRPFLHPIICILLGASPETKQPMDDSEITDLFIKDPIIDPANLFVESVAITVSRSLAHYPFLPKMTLGHLKRMETELKQTFKHMTTGPKNGTQPELLKDKEEKVISRGSYFSLENIPRGLERQLDKDGLLFDRNDQGIKAGKGYENWPVGRGIFLIGQTERTMPQDPTRKKVFLLYQIFLIICS